MHEQGFPVAAAGELRSSEPRLILGPALLCARVWNRPRKRDYVVKKSISPGVATGTAFKRSGVQAFERSSVRAFERSSVQAFERSRTTGSDSRRQEALVSVAPFDVAVLGAGTAGAATALQCARRGLRVLLLDKRPRDACGARWVNGVNVQQFADADIDLPRGDECISAPVDFHLIAENGPTKVIVPSEAHGVMDVDMRLLVARLQSEAEEFGVVFLDDATVSSTNAELERGEVRIGSTLYRAAVVVDATGLAGRHLLGGPRVPREHLCVASQAVFEVRDHRQADAFFAQHDVPVGEVCCFTGVEGGYSIINVRKDEDHIAVLTGSIPSRGVRSGTQMLDAFVDAHASMFGPHLFGGHRAIPLRRPRDVLGRGQVAAVGDSGCQVLSAHGSGIAQGMIAGRLLADTLAAGGQPKDYSRTFLRRQGGLLAAFDLFRRFSSTFTPDDLRLLMGSGLFDAATAGDGMAQVWPQANLDVALAKLRGLPKARRLLPRVVPVVVKMGVVAALYANVPEEDDIATFSRRVARVFRELPDI